MPDITIDPALLRRVVDAVGEGIWVLDSQGRTVYVNPAAQAMTGFAPEDLLGKVSHHVIHHSHADGSTYPIEQCPIYASVFRGERCDKVEGEVFWRADGTSFPVRYSSMPIVEDDGTISGAVQVFRDVSTERAAADTTRRLDQATLLQQQALQINDEVMQGLTIAKLALELDNPEQARTALDATLVAARGIIDQLLASATDDAGTLQGMLRRDVAAMSPRAGSR